MRRGREGREGRGGEGRGGKGRGKEREGRKYILVEAGAEHTAFPLSTRRLCEYLRGDRERRRGGEGESGRERGGVLVIHDAAMA